MKHIRKLIMMVVSTAGVLAALTVPMVRGDSPPLEPGNDQGLFVVEDALDQFNALKHHGEALGWTLPEANGAPDPTLFDHYQGLARNPNVGILLFYVTQLDDDGGSSGGYLHVVRFGSRSTDGERMRSNLQQVGGDTKHTAPGSQDTWVCSIRFNGSVGLPLYRWVPAYKHPGGMAIVDDVLFVALDDRVSEYTPAGEYVPVGQIVLFDLRPDPQTPKAIKAFPLTHSIDNLAVTRHQDGTYLVFTNGGGGEVVKFYETNGTDLRDTNLGLVFVQNWDDDSSADYVGTHGSSVPDRV